MEKKRALTWDKNSHWAASPDSRYQQQNLFRWKDSSWSQSTQVTMEILYKEAVEEEACYCPGTALSA